MPSIPASSCWVSQELITDAAPFVLLAFLATVLVARGASLIYYFYRYKRSGRGSIKEALRETTANVEAYGEPVNDIAALEPALREVGKRQMDISLVGGSVSTAAWTALFIAASNNSVDTGISDRTLAMLLSGAMVLLAGPICFRSEEFYFKYLMRESLLYLGFTIVLFSVCSIAIDKGGVAGAIGALILALGVVVADVAEVRSHRKMLRDFLPDQHRDAMHDSEPVDTPTELPAGLA
jgi:hypothetical protein